MGAPQSQREGVQRPRKPPTVTVVPAKPSGFVRLYLFLYNLISLLRWSYILFTAVDGLAKRERNAQGAFTFMYDSVFLTLLSTQTCAALEIVHSCLKIVRAGFVTTAMQVASRLIVVWMVLYSFGRGGPLLRAGEVGIVGVDANPSGQIGDVAFTGAVLAWSLTECVRYAFFSISLLGLKVPGFLVWLR